MPGWYNNLPGQYNIIWVRCGVCTMYNRELDEVWTQYSLPNHEKISTEVHWSINDRKFYFAWNFIKDTGTVYQKLKNSDRVVCVMHHVPTSDLSKLVDKMKIYITLS